MALIGEYPLNPKKVLKKTLSWLLTPLFGLVILIPFSIFLWWLLLPLLLLLLLLAAIAYLYEREYYRRYFYDLTENGLEIKKGVFFPNSITIPTEKVSDVYVDQDLLDRLFGLYDLHFASASLTSGQLAHIDGLDAGTSSALRTYLMAVFKKGAAAQPAAAGGEEAAPAISLAAFKPSPSGFHVLLLGHAISLLFLLIIAFPIFLLLIPLILIYIFYIKKEFDSKIYEVREDCVWIRKGWLTPSETSLFYKNIQDIDVSQPLLERLFGLQHVAVKSMSYESAVSAQLEYLTAADAEKVRSMVNEQISKWRASQQRKAKPAALPSAKAGAAAPIAPLPAPTPVIYSGEELLSPYKNEFFKGAPLLSLNLVLLLIFLAFASLLASLFGFGLGWLAAGGFVLAAAFVFGLSLLDALINQMTYSYALGKEGVVIALGLLARQKKVLRYEKIQDIKLYCSFFESFLGIANMHIETGSKDVEVSGRGRTGVALSGATLTERIPYLKLDDAYALRAKLLEITGIAYPESKEPLRSTCPLSPKKPLKKSIAEVGILKPQLLLVALAFALLVPQLSLISAGIAALLFLYIVLMFPVRLWYENLYMQRYFYDENAETLVIRKGVFGWSEIVVPFRNIQSVYIDQDWYDVYFDLWDVWITTVTATSGAMAHIDGTDRENAERLARLLTDRVEKSRRRR